MNVQEKRDEIAEISIRAVKETELQRSLVILQETLDPVDLPTIFYKDAKDVFILGDCDETQTIIDDSRVSIANIAANRYVGALWDQVDTLQK